MPYFIYAFERLGELGLGKGRGEYELQKVAFHSMNVDFKGLIEKAKQVDKIKEQAEWYDWERYSGRKEEWIKMGGIVGEVAFQGDLERFFPLLKLGEYIHVGKGTAFGLGRYEII